jgi:hypothetical protein
VALVLRIKGDRVDQFRRAADRALLDLGMALRDFAGLHESVGNVGDELAATDREALGETTSALQTASIFGPVP